MNRTYQHKIYLTPKEKAFNFSVSQIQEQNINETSLQQCMSPGTPISDLSFYEKPLFLASIGKKSDKNKEGALVQSIVIQAYQSNYTEMKASINSLERNKTQKIQKVKYQCQICQSQIICSPKKFLQISKQKMQCLIKLINQLKAENQDIKSKVINDFVSLKDLIKDWKIDIQKKIVNRLNYQLNSKNNVIKELQKRVQNLICKVYHLQAQNQEINKSNTIKYEQLAQKYNYLLLQYKINQRQLTNIRQNRKQLQYKLIQKESCLISCQAAKQNIQDINHELSLKIKNLQRSLSLNYDNPENFNTSLKNVNNFDDLSYSKNKMIQSYKAPTSSRSSKQMSSFFSNLSAFNYKNQKKKGKKTRNHYNLSFVSQENQRSELNQNLKPKNQMENFRVNNKNLSYSYQRQNTIQLAINSVEKTKKLIPDIFCPLRNKNQKIQLKYILPQQIQVSRNEEIEKQQNQMLQIKNLKLKIQQLKQSLKDQIRSNKKKC